MTTYLRHPASFKDPSGFVFSVQGFIYRQVNQFYATQYEHLISSGLYQLLTNKSLLLSHIEINENLTGSRDWYKTILPEQISFISYPYEWCFNQLKDAALLTLAIMRSAIDHGMILKDATPLNVQFYKGKAIFIDTLSFDLYDATQPWVAYRQFCECFLFPLYLEFYLKADVQKIMTTYLDGIPVEVTSKLLPVKSSFNLGVWLHVHLQNNIKAGEKDQRETMTTFGRRKMLNLISHLESIIHRFTSTKPARSAWSSYYEETILGKEYLKEKERIFIDFTSEIDADSVLDIGGNDGYFSKLLANQGRKVITIDTDSQSITNLYQYTAKHNINNILPLIIDISNPSPSLGFDHRERQSFDSRLKADLVLALALIHHLVITRNISLKMIAEYLHSISPQLIIEFVPSTDEKVKEMLSNRRGLFSDYTINSFESIFGELFMIVRKQLIRGTGRILYHMRRK